MFRSGSFVLRFLAFLLLVGVLIAGGVMIYQAGQAQGYALGMAASSKDLGVPAQTPGVVPGVPYAPGYWPGYYYWRPHFFPFGPLFGLFFFFLFIFAIGGLFRAFAWRRHPMMGHYGPWGPQGPGGQGQKDQPEGSSGTETGQRNP